MKTNYSNKDRSPLRRIKVLIVAFTLLITATTTICSRSEVNTDPKSRKKILPVYAGNVIVTTPTTTTSEITTLTSTTTTSTTTTTTTSTTSTTTTSIITTTPITTTTIINTEVSDTIATSEIIQEEQTDLPITSYEYDLLCKIVCSEYGGMPDVEERAKIVASVMNQSTRLHKSIEACLYQTCVPWGFNINGTYFCGVHYTAMSDAVDYYFNNRDMIFAGWDADSWYGSDGYNHFHRQLY